MLVSNLSRGVTSHLPGLGTHELAAATSPDVCPRCAGRARVRGFGRYTRARRGGGFAFAELPGSPGPPRCTPLVTVTSARATQNMLFGLKRTLSCMKGKGLASSLFLLARALLPSKESSQESSRRQHAGIEWN